MIMAEMLADWKVRGNSLKLFEDENSIWISLNGKHVCGEDAANNPFVSYALEEGILESAVERGCGRKVS